MVYTLENDLLLKREFDNNPSVNCVAIYTTNKITFQVMMKNNELHPNVLAALNEIAEEYYYKNTLIRADHKGSLIIYYQRLSELGED